MASSCNKYSKLHTTHKADKLTLLLLEDLNRKCQLAWLGPIDEQVNELRASEVFGHFAVDSFHSDVWGIDLLYHSFFQSMTSVNSLELNVFS